MARGSSWALARCASVQGISVHTTELSGLPIRGSCMGHGNHRDRRGRYSYPSIAYRTIASGVPTRHLTALESLAQHVTTRRCRDGVLWRQFDAQQRMAPVQHKGALRSPRRTQPLASDYVAATVLGTYPAERPSPYDSHRFLCPPTRLAPSSIPYVCISSSSGHSVTPIITQLDHNLLFCRTLPLERGPAFSEEHCTEFPLKAFKCRLPAWAKAPSRYHGGMAGWQYRLPSPETRPIQEECTRARDRRVPDGAALPPKLAEATIKPEACGAIPAHTSWVKRGMWKV